MSTGAAIGEVVKGVKGQPAQRGAEEGENYVGCPVSHDARSHASAWVQTILLMYPDRPKIGSRGEKGNGKDAGARKGVVCIEISRVQRTVWRHRASPIASQ